MLWASHDFLWLNGWICDPAPQKQVGVWSGFDNYSLAVGSSSDSSSLPLIYLCGKCGLCVYSVYKRRVVSGQRISQAESNKMEQEIEDICS